MSSRQKFFVAFLAVLVFGAGTFSLGFLMGDNDDQRAINVSGSPDATVSATGLEAINQTLQDILATSVEPPSERALVKGAIKGMVNVVKKAGDKYAEFYSPESYLALQELTSGEFSGVGTVLKENKKGYEIVSVLPSTPAFAAGLARGDLVVTVDGDDAAKMTSDEVINNIKGIEGSEVTLGIERDGTALEFTITRASIELPNLRVSMEEGNIGYVQLFGFGRGAGGQLRTKVALLIAKGAKGIILDLRDNGGGLLQEGVSVASTFVEDGKIVIYREPHQDDVVYEAEGKAFPDIPVVVLVNEGTASASEIVAGALQDRGRAILIGTETYGKGSVQQIVPLAFGLAMKLTTAAYLTPSGRDINGTGIEPDVVAAGGPESQKTRAIEILQEILLSGSTDAG